MGGPPPPSLDHSGSLPSLTTHFIATFRPVDYFTLYEGPVVRPAPSTPGHPVVPIDAAFAEMENTKIERVHAPHLAPLFCAPTRSTVESLENLTIEILSSPSNTRNDRTTSEKRFGATIVSPKRIRIKPDLCSPRASLTPNKIGDYLSATVGNCPAVFASPLFRRGGRVERLQI